MAGSAASLVRLAAADKVDHVSSSAHLTALLIHARALIEFLVGRKGPKGRRWHREDVSPMDLGLADWNPATIVVMRLEKHMRQIDKDVAHLSHTRARISQIWWNYPKLVNDVLAHLDGVLDELYRRKLSAARHLHAWVRTARRDWMEALNEVPANTLLLETGPLDLLHITPVGENQGTAAALIGQLREQVSNQVGAAALPFRYALLQPPDEDP